MKWLLYVILCCSVLTSWAQNDVIYSHYLFNPSYYNPAFVGRANISHAILQFRSQWTGYQPSFDASGGAPLTQTLTGMIPLTSGLSGVGIQATNDQLGPVNNVIIGIPISYTIKSDRNEWTFGLSPMVYSQVINFNFLRFVNPADPFNVGTRESQVLPNFNAGVVWSNAKRLLIGMSALNITQPTFDYGLDSLSSQLKRSYSLIASYELRVSRDIQIIPNLHLRSDLSTFSFDFGAFLNYKQKGWIGTSYRYAESLSFFIGYSLLADNKLQIGYALDYVIDERQAKQPTSQEFYIRYNLPNLVIGGRKQVKTPRFAF